MLAALLLLCSYLFGAVPFGYLLVKLRSGKDIRQVGSGNIGMANAMRASGPLVGAIVLVLDALKGAAPLLVASGLELPLATGAWAALLAVAGHNWSPFLGFRGGGKGVATSLGAVLVLSPLVAGLLVVVWIACVAITRYSSVGSIAGLAVAPVLMWMTGQAREAVLFGLAAGALGIFQHRANLARLTAGQEHKITERTSRSRGV